MTIRNRRIRALALLTLGTTASFGLLADSGDRRARGPVSISDLQIRVDERFNAIDTDDSESLSLDEYLAAEVHEERAGHRGRPRHGKGWGGPHRGGPHRGGPHRGGPHLGGLKQGDGATDSNFDPAAFEAAVFEAMDANGDGALSAEEAGRENRQVATRRVMRETRFERLDSNADGQLDRVEFNEPVLRLTAADLNADGQVSREEMRAAREQKKS